MAALDALSGLSVFLASFAMAEGRDIIVIGALLVILSVLGAFEFPTVQACIPQMLSGSNIVKGNAIVNQVSSIASLITPFLGSVFYAAFGIRPVFYGAVLCFFLTALLECFIQLDYQKPADHMGIGAIIKEDFSVSMHFLRREQPDILKLLLLAAAVSLFVAGTAVVGFPYLVRTVLGLPAAYYGVAESAMVRHLFWAAFVSWRWRKKSGHRILSAYWPVSACACFPAALPFYSPFMPLPAI